MLQLADDVQGNGDGEVQRGETATLYLHVKNVGQGKTYTTQANLQNQSGRGVLLRGGRFRVDSIEPGEERIIPFTFKVLEDFEQPKAKFEVSLIDTDLRVSFNEKFDVVVNKDAQMPQADIRTVTVIKGAIIHEKPNARSRKLGNIEKDGKQFSAEAALNGFLRIDLGEGRPGWVAANKVSPSAQPGATGVLHEYLYHQLPVIALDVGNDLVTRQSKLHVEGSAADNSRVRDVYIFVGSK
ncbi:MAG: hypothetical protein IPJ88_12345 [Myxococcales bacterium]|nr:MAG: hypothetical protein IPJ88_12345 [Myxococcales bacterium]